MGQPLQNPSEIQFIDPTLLVNLFEDHTEKFRFTARSHYSILEWLKLCIFLHALLALAMFWLAGYEKY